MSALTIALSLFLSSSLTWAGEVETKSLPSTGSAGSSAADVLVDKIVATVAGRPILYSDVMQKVDKGPLVVVSEFPLDETAAPFDRAMQDAVNFQLVLSRAKELEIDVRDEEVAEEIKVFLDARGLTRDGLLEHLRQSGTTFDEYKRDFKDQMILRKFQGRVIAPLIKITDKDVETYYLKKAGAAADLMELVLRQLLIAVPSTAVPNVVDAKRRLAAEVHQKITDGMTFAEAVKIYSEDQNGRQTGGLMPPVRAKDLMTSIKSAVEVLDVGQFTQPVQTALGFHIFLLEDKKFAGSRDFQNKKRQLENDLRNLELVEQTRHWLSEQRQRTKVDLLPQ